jgi:hypothetical protein
MLTRVVLEFPFQQQQGVQLSAAQYATVLLPVSTDGAS